MSRSKKEDSMAVVSVVIVVLGGKFSTDLEMKLRLAVWLIFFAGFFIFLDGEID
jgi:hypothetical protein